MTLRTITEFLNETHPEQRQLCGAWLRTGELVMLFAPRGTGKSIFVTSLATSVATGMPFLGAKPPRQARVLTLDAETPDRLAAKRFCLAEMASQTSPKPGNLRIWSRDDTGYLPNLSTPEGQAEYWPAFMEADLIIIDNLLTVAPPVDARDDDVKIWYRIKTFLYRLRNADKCVLLVHHAGKSGQQLGTSLRENDMDIIIRLTNPTYVESKRLSMYLDFEKTRDLSPAERESLFLEYEIIDAVPQWTHRPAAAYRKAEIRRLATTISNKPLLAAMLNCPLWFVHQTLTEKEPTKFDEVGIDDDETLPF